MAKWKGDSAGLVCTNAPLTFALPFFPQKTLQTSDSALPVADAREQERGQGDSGQAGRAQAERWPRHDNGMRRPEERDRSPQRDDLFGPDRAPNRGKATR